MVSAPPRKRLSSVDRDVVADKAEVDVQAGLAKFAQYMLMLAAPPIVDGSARRNRTPDERAAYFREAYGAGI